VKRIDYPKAIIRVALGDRRYAKYTTSIAGALLGLGMMVICPPIGRAQEEQAKDKEKLVIYSHDDDVACKFGKQPRAVLIIDFAKALWTTADLKDMDKKFKELGWEVDYVDPAFTEVPVPYSYSADGTITGEVDPPPDKIKAAVANNKAQWDRVEDAIASHVKRELGKLDVALEIVNATVVQVKKEEIGAGILDR